VLPSLSPLLIEDRSHDVREDVLFTSFFCPCRWRRRRALPSFHDPPSKTLPPLFFFISGRRKSSFSFPLFRDLAWSMVMQTPPLHSLFFCERETSWPFGGGMTPFSSLSLNFQRAAADVSSPPAIMLRNCPSFLIVRRIETVAPPPFPLPSFFHPPAKGRHALVFFFSIS